MSKHAILIGIAGGTASGKTSVSREITKNFPKQHVALIEQDSYYHDHKDITVEERAKINYDHPEAFDFNLMREHMLALLSGQKIHVPQYDYDTHSRSSETTPYQGQKIVVLEGIMALFNEELRNLMDIKIYVDTSDDIRIIRRLKRDMEDRARSFDSVINQYFETVRPMHRQFIEPSKTWADIIIPQGASNKVGIDILKTKIKDLLN